MLEKLGTCKASRFEFESADLIRFDLKVMCRLENFRIGHACPLLIVVKRLTPLTAVSGTVYRLASSMSDHMLVLFNIFVEWNEKSVVPHAHLFCFIFN